MSQTKGIAIASCGIAPAACCWSGVAYLIERASAMLDRWHSRITLRASIGAEGVAEFVLCPPIRSCRPSSKPTNRQIVYIANYVVENIRRYTMIARIEMARPISPWEKSFPSARQIDPTDKIDRSLKQMIEGTKRACWRAILK